MPKILKISVKIILILLGAIFLFYLTWFINVYYKSKISKKNTAIIRRMEKQHDSLVCLCMKHNAYENLRRGNVIAYYYGPYFKEIVYKRYHIYSEFMNDCARSIMDSVILRKYGKDFYSKNISSADSLYKINDKIYIDLDGYYTVSEKNPEYNCGGIEGLFNYIYRSLDKSNLAPLFQDTCFADEINIDAIITKEGKLIMPRVLKKVNPKIDSFVLKLLINLPCGWSPAIDDLGKNTDFRKEFNFNLKEIKRQK